MELNHSLHSSVTIKVCEGVVPLQVTLSLLLLINGFSTARRISGSADKAWIALDPDERYPYEVQSKEAFAKLDADILAFNARIPLSPLVEVHSESLGIPTDPSGEPAWDAYTRNLQIYREHVERSRRRGLQLWNRYRKDHPHADGGAVVPMPDKAFRFLALPQELRNMIYRTLLYRSRPVKQMESNRSAKHLNLITGEGPIDLRVFAVCRQMYEEATSVFFACNIIRIDLGEKLLPPIFRQTSQLALLGKLRRIDVHLPLYQSHEAAPLIWLLKRLCHALMAQSQLTEMKLSPFVPLCWYTPNLHEEMDRVLETLTVLRGMKCVFNAYRQAVLSDEKILLGTEAQRQRVQEIAGSPK